MSKINYEEDRVAKNILGIETAPSKENIKSLKIKCKDLNMFSSYLKGQKDIVKKVKKMMPALTRKHTVRNVGSKKTERGKKYEINSRKVLKEIIKYLKLRDNLHDQWLKENHDNVQKYAERINKIEGTSFKLKKELESHG